MASTDGTSTYYGADTAFTTMSSVSALPATVLSSRAATLNGRVTPDGVPASTWFEWGTTTNYGSSTMSTNVGGGTNVVLLNFDLTGLWPASTYHYRVGATDGTSTYYGADTAFTTMPNVWTLLATVLSLTSASLNGRVNPDGLETTAWFEWGTTTNYGSRTTMTNLGSDTDAVLAYF